MKQLARWIILGSGMSLAALAFAAAPSFPEIVDNLESRTHTKLQADQYWKSLKGQEVTWSAVVVEVQSRDRGEEARLLLVDKSRPLYDGYNIRIDTRDVAKANTITRGQTVRFTGVLTSYHQKNPGVVIDLKKGKLP